MKVHLLHDWLTGYRGGERVLDAFCELFPTAPLSTLIYSPGTLSKRIESREIHASFLNKIPKISEHYRKFLPLFPLAAESLAIPDDVQLVFSSSHCVIKGVKKPKSAQHISYIHSPMRYLYDQYDQYFGKGAPLYQQLGAKVFRSYLTNWDIRSNENVDVMIANSEFVRQRIKTYYQRDSIVIHPFVDLADFRNQQVKSVEKDDFYLMVSAFAPNKRIDLAIDAFNKNGRKLKIVGGGQQEKSLRELAKQNIEFLGYQSRERIVDLYSRARAFVFPGVEDFGITPLESLASATPIIAFKAGGVLETLNENVAQFFWEATPESLNAAVEEFESRKFDQEKLRERAEMFSREQFLRRIQAIVGSTQRTS